MTIRFMSAYQAFTAFSLTERMNVMHGHPDGHGLVGQQQGGGHDVCDGSMADSGSKERGDMADAVIAFNNVGNSEHGPEWKAEIEG
jgi:hypothetical protein